jgi:holliday junction DNA helicase RuvA
VIGWLRGTLREKRPPQLLLEVQGVGYELEAPMSTFYALPAVGEPVQLFTHLVVREDAASCSMVSPDRGGARLFRDLLRVNGVGAKIGAGAALGYHGRGVHALRGVEGDTAALCASRASESKTAERLVIEMRDRSGARGRRPLPGAAGRAVADPPQAEALRWWRSVTSRSRRPAWIKARARRRALHARS